jgi:hypothetical protein
MTHDKLSAEERFKVVIGKAMYTESLKRDFIAQIKSAEAAAFEEGEKAMREKAAKVAENSSTVSDQYDIAEAVRALSLSGGGKE